MAHLTLTVSQQGFNLAWFWQDISTVGHSCLSETHGQSYLYYGKNLEAEIFTFWILNSEESLLT